MALLRKTTCILRHPMSLRHSVVVASNHWCITIMSLQWLLLPLLHIDIAHRHCIAYRPFFLSPVYYSHVIGVITIMASTASLRVYTALHIVVASNVVAYRHCFACSGCFSSRCIYTLRTDFAWHIVVASYHQYITIMSLQSLHS